MQTSTLGHLPYGTTPGRSRRLWITIVVAIALPANTISRAIPNAQTMGHAPLGALLRMMGATNIVGSPSTLNTTAAIILRRA